MTAQKLTIDNKPIDNLVAEKGLNALLESDPLKKLHDGNSNVTEEELGSLLDVVNSGQNEINEDDRADILSKVNISPDQFIELVKEYQNRFPQGTKKIGSSLFPAVYSDAMAISTFLRNENVGSPPPQNSVNGVWTLEDLFSPDILNAIRNKKEIVKGGFRVHHDAQYQVLRINNAHGWDLVFNIWLDGEGKVSRVSRDDSSDRGKFTQAIIDIESDKIFLPGTAQRFGINPEDISKAAESKKLGAELTQINTSDLNSLPSSFEYQQPNTIGVLQGDARFLNPTGKIDGLYTMGAGPCAILIAVSRDSGGHVTNIGMAHIDGMVREQYIDSFFQRLGQNDKNTIEIHVISGDEDIAFRILKASQNASATIRFFNADFHGDRSDAAIVDREGKVYYGFREDFRSLFDF
ncbi:MAG: hypothetical protein HYU97_01695 [Deltaproteobacteria bacterium]|nr:hypothetical protein [Deltaproteobacteria bacterium]